MDLMNFLCSLSCQLARRGFRLPGTGQAWKLAGDRGAQARGTVYGERPAQRLDAVFQPEQPRAACGGGTTDAVVPHPYPQCAAAGFHDHLDHRGTRVLGRVGKHLRDHVVGGYLDRLRKPEAHSHVDHDGDRRAPAAGRPRTRWPGVCHGRIPAAHR